MIMSTFRQRLNGVYLSSLYICCHSNNNNNTNTNNNNNSNNNNNNNSNNNNSNTNNNSNRGDLGAYIYSTLVPGSGTFQLSRLAGYRLGLGFF